MFMILVVNVVKMYSITTIQGIADIATMVTAAAFLNSYSM